MVIGMVKIVKSFKIEPEHFKQLKKRYPKQFINLSGTIDSLIKEKFPLIDTNSLEYKIKMLAVSISQNTNQIKELMDQNKLLQEEINFYNVKLKDGDD